MYIYSLHIYKNGHGSFAQENVNINKTVDIKRPDQPKDHPYELPPEKRPSCSSYYRSLSDSNEVKAPSVKCIEL